MKVGFRHTLGKRGRAFSRTLIRCVLVYRYDLPLVFAAH